MTIETITPADYKTGRTRLTVNLSFAKSRFGQILIASTPKGICHLTFVDQQRKDLKRLKTAFPRATFKKKRDRFQQNALSLLMRNGKPMNPIYLHVQGSAFQLKVWKALLKIPRGHLSTYGRIAKSIGRPSAARAVGSAVGKNPVACLIPCHRVVPSTGAIGNYHWGSARKTALINSEAEASPIRSAKPAKSATIPRW